jgi:maltodextrin utilization protein YvdJ
MILLNGGDEGFANFAVNWWQIYFIIAFVISLIIFVIVNAQRREEY